MTKADPEFVCLCIYQWSGECGQMGNSSRKGGGANPEGVN